MTPSPGQTKDLLHVPKLALASTDESFVAFVRLISSRGIILSLVNTPAVKPEVAGSSIGNIENSQAYFSHRFGAPSVQN